MPKPVVDTDLKNLFIINSVVWVYRKLCIERLTGRCRPSAFMLICLTLLTRTLRYYCNTVSKLVYKIIRVSLFSVAKHKKQPSYSASSFTSSSFSYSFTLFFLLILRFLLPLAPPPPAASSFPSPSSSTSRSSSLCQVVGLSNCSGFISKLCAICLSLCFL